MNVGLKRYTGTPVYRGYGGTDMYRDTQKQIMIKYDTFVTYTKVRKEHKIHINNQYIQITRVNLAQIHCTW